MTRYTAQDIRGVVGIMPTPSVPGSDRWDAQNTVDLAETERMTEGLIAAGIDILMTNGTFGECATLTLDELLAFNDTVIQTARGRVPVFSGATTLNTRDTIARGRMLADLGANGLFLGRPMWVALDEKQIVEYHSSIAEALPQMSQVMYDNASAFKGKIPTGAYAQLSQVPQVVASKHLGVFKGDDPAWKMVGEQFVKDLKAVEGRIRLLSMAELWLSTIEEYPEEGVACWSGEAACGPAPLMRLKEGILGGDLEAARVVHVEIGEAMKPLMPAGGFQEFSRYNMQIDRAEFEGAGWITPGPLRPPYTSCPEEYLEGGREAGRRWAALQARYSPVAAA